MKIIFKFKDGSSKQFQLSINQVSLTTTNEDASSGILEIHNIQKKMFEFIVLKDELSLEKLKGIIIMNDARETADAIEMIIPVEYCTDYQAGASITGNYIKFYFQITDKNEYINACSKLINN